MQGLRLYKPQHPNSQTTLRSSVGYSAVPEADRSGGEGAGAQAEFDDGVLPAPYSDHLDGLRRPRSTTALWRHADPGSAAAAPPRGQGEAERRRERDHHQAAAPDGGRHGLDAAADDEAWAAVASEAVRCTGVRGAADEPVRRSENGNRWSWLLCDCAYDIGLTMLYLVLVKGQKR
jgi:hypothetical protein